MASQDTDSPTIYVQKIACVNNAAFVMKFAVEFEQGGATKATSETENYPINQSRVIDLAEHGLALRTAIWPFVRAFWGKDARGPRLSYSPNGQTATFSVTGTTLHYAITRVG